MPTIALATYAALPDLADDDRLLISALGSRGARAAPAVWDDPGVDWDAFDAVVIRSCWDYHLRVDEFLAWIARVEQAGVEVWNPPHVLRWNARKTYLRDLAARGVRTIPTRWIGGDGGGAEADDAGRDRAEPDGAPGTPAEEIPSLTTTMEHAGWDDVVVKPVVSASAHETWRVARSDAATGEHDARIRAMAAEGVMLQPFVHEIARDGEWSFVFFGDRFSHAVLKQAARGDFRVQREHGGSARPVRPPDHLVRQAHAALRAAPGPTLYARVDGVVVNGDLVIGELELLEPSLFLDTDPGAPELMARVLLERLAPNPAG